MYSAMKTDSIGEIMLARFTATLLMDAKVALYFFGVARMRRPAPITPPEVINMPPNVKQIHII